MSYQVEHGVGIFGDPSGITSILSADGQPAEALTTARAEVFDPHVWILALRAPGVDPHEFIDLLAGWL